MNKQLSLFNADAPEQQDPDAYQTGWSKEWGNERLSELRAGLKQGQVERIRAHNQLKEGLFNDRRSEK